MARHFVAASSQQLTNSNPPVTAVPCTMHCWYKPTQHTVRTWPLVVYSSGDGSLIIALAVNGSGNAQAWQNDDSTTGQASSAGTVTDNVWQAIGAVFTSTTAQTAYLNGTGTSSSQGAVTPTAIDSTRVGQHLGEFYDGDLAECAIWNAALTATEMMMLALGVSPLLVRPSTLVAYWPLLYGYSPEIDPIGRYELTLNNAPTLVAGPALYLADFPTAVRGGGTPVGGPALNVTLAEPVIGGSIF